MKSKTIKVAFCSPKGGVGKSTFTILTASCLHYVKGLNVGVVDADYPQWSIFRARERETLILNQAVYYQERMVNQFKATGQRIYPVIASRPEDAITDCSALLRGKERHFDIVFFDLPGTLNSDGVLQTIAALDHIFIPITSDPLVMESTLAFMDVIVNSVIGNPNEAIKLKSATLFWTMVDKRERTVFYDQYDKVIRDSLMQRFETHIPERKRFNKELSLDPASTYRTTMFPPDSRFLRESGMNSLLDEIMAQINL